MPDDSGLRTIERVANRVKAGMSNGEIAAELKIPTNSVSAWKAHARREGLLPKVGEVVRPEAAIEPPKTNPPVRNRCAQKWNEGLSVADIARELEFEEDFVERQLDKAIREGILKRAYPEVAPKVPLPDGRSVPVAAKSPKINFDFRRGERVMLISGGPTLTVCDTRTDEDGDPVVIVAFANERGFHTLEVPAEALMHV